MSGNRRSEDAGEVPWPALVDLLTSVLITFMFFVLVTTVAMSTMTVKTAMESAKKNQQNSKSQEKPTPASTGTDDIAQVSPTVLKPPAAVSITMLPPPVEIEGNKLPADMLTENEKLKEENEKLKQQLSAMTTSFAKSTEINVENEDAARALTLLFNRNEAGMLPKAQAAVARFITQVGGGMPQPVRVQITASQPNGISFSQARERALTRAMVVRNVLLELKIDPKLISFVYDESTERFKSHDWVRLQLLPAGGAR